MLLDFDLGAGSLIDLVIFDCDGTLVDSESIAARVTADLFRDLGVELTPDFNAAVRAAALLVRVTSLAGGALCLWWALALDRGAVRGEFVRKV